MTLQQLVYFRTAAELGSFNAAARQLHCTQPAVSDQVRRLEQELGVSLFARAGRGLTLTSAGRVFLGHAERVTAAADDAIASVGRRATGEQVLTVGTVTSLIRADVYKWGMLMAGALVAAAPPLVIYAFLMDYYIAGLTAGATKG